ncbi:hypothetical protein DFH07DRAFT_1008764 [Mycena maculata]|uniref:Uncharacterized protein n=1 Tax=Mycena maculata TaxID=230809 RepID=A0AAD7NNG7_9AGAR|nr:hypothetical protein DFH07DRAFT_1008764 [Mycena maculata]
MSKQTVPSVRLVKQVVPSAKASPKIRNFLYWRPVGRAGHDSDWFDVLISAIGAMEQLAQIQLATAAKGAGAKRFVPWGFTTVAPPGGVMPLRDKISFPTVPSGPVDYASFMKPKVEFTSTPLGLLVSAEEVEASRAATIQAEPNNTMVRMRSFGEDYNFSKYVQGGNAPTYAAHFGYLDVGELDPDFQPRRFAAEFLDGRRRSHISSGVWV